MTKEDVLKIMGAPTDTVVTQISPGPISVSSTIPHAKLEILKLQMELATEKMSQEVSNSIWTYQGTIPLDATKMKSPASFGDAMSEAFKAIAQVYIRNVGWKDGKIHGHTLKFDGHEKLVEISSD